MRRTAHVSSPGTAMRHLSSLHGAIGNGRVAKLLMAGTQVVQKQPDKPKPEEKPKQDKVETADPKQSPWSRNKKGDPTLLDDNDASYKASFEHVLPPVPKGVKQFWQVVEVDIEVLTEKCKLEKRQAFIVDIIDIGNRTTIGDNWKYVLGGNPCFVLELNKAVVGFDDQKSKFKEKASQDVSAGEAKKVLRRMKEPIGRYSGRYTFVKQGLWCRRCEKELAALQKQHAAPAGEALSIDGVGDFKVKRDE
jgi:hypothetical protein